MKTITEIKAWCVMCHWEGTMADCVNKEDEMLRCPTCGEYVSHDCDCHQCRDSERDKQSRIKNNVIHDMDTESPVHGIVNGQIESEEKEPLHVPIELQEGFKGKPDGAYREIGSEPTIKPDPTVEAPPNVLITEGWAPPPGDGKVYCPNCNSWGIDFWSRIERCYHPENMLIISNYKGHEKVYRRRPCLMNVDNHCSWYRRKWWLFWIK